MYHRKSQIPIDWAMKSASFASFPYDAVEELYRMAKHDIVPGSEFSDMECSVWEMFRHLLSEDSDS